MKIYGPFRGINNPLIMGMFGLQVLDEGLKVYQAHHEAQQRDLLAHSLTSGQVEPSEPGGPIRQGLSKLTGGIVSPDVEADPETIMAEQQGQQQKQDQQLKSLSLISAIRNNIGSGPFSAGSPLDMLQQQNGGSPGMMAGETQKEKTDRERVAQQQVTNQQHSPAGRAAVKQAELDVTNSPANVATSLGINRARVSQDAAIRESAALDTAAKEAPLKISMAGAIADITNDKLARRDQQKKDALDNTPVSDLAGNKTSGGVYVRRKDLKLATGATGEPTTKKEADSNPDYMFVPNKQVDGPGGLKDTIAQVHKVDEMLGLLNSGAADDIFPSGKNKNWAALKVDQLDYGSENNAKRSQDPVRNKWYNMYADLVRYYTGLQHRFPNTKELSIPLTPDPGGLVPSEHPILHLGGVNPIRAADTKEVAQQKLMDMRDTILGHFSTGAGIGTLEGDDEDTADFTAAARESGAMR
jgi:hypothetical protein